MNWGTKIAVGMSIFMVFIVVMVFTMFNSKTDALVDNDYYEKSINYDKVYDKKEQVKLDSAAPVIAVHAENIILVFKAPSQGTIRLMRT
ncbi:MAG: FixH family protein, partial [Pedobacter sp.]|nr:FixH family protein [Pedobacter sp.]